MCVFVYRKKERVFRLHTVALFAAAAASTAFGCEFNDKKMESERERGKIQMKEKRKKQQQKKVEHHDYCKETLLPSDIACRRRRIAAAAAVPHIFPLSFMCSAVCMYIESERARERVREGSW